MRRADDQETTVSRFPFPFPNGWYRALYSDELAAGEVKTLRYMARELVAFRDEAGGTHLLDAYCPHLGAHLGVGGEVVGSALRCPFHHWEWAGDGSCRKIPYAKRIPAGARLRAYPTEERHGLLYFWFHAEGEPPGFDLPEIPEYGDPGFTPDWSRSGWTIRTHPQEILENGVDWQHLTPVHQMDPPEGFRFDANGPYSTWSVGAAKNADPVASRYVGFFSTLLHLAYTPIDEDACVVAVGSIGSRTDRSGEQAGELLEAYMADVAGQIDRDKPIWENKLYRDQPMLCEEDGPIPEYRRWASQFYSGSPRLAAKETPRR
jgi:phenylpropionate dioxygenase-like ring-hydroxylating dioxygenase large terminal subunit